MNHSTVPFISIISTFSNTGMYNKEIKEDLLQLVSAIEEYIKIKLTSSKLVCKSFIRHLTRLLERIYNHQLIQAESKDGATSQYGIPQASKTLTDDIPKHIS
ncbi:hypothetical protein [Niallia endozanthoxylica]|uniref:Uncharacterized protein n=1 Tax=Niallia endozanthoxylica TaxID=2036016 RepID=A0A5J5HMM9_9BACI|nr:hypothetical protein [Niallia endozanthoxylica]KAA9021053.1 hypothetical protein F4V44_18080 [Niallia endozanthoxylica]